VRPPRKQVAREDSAIYAQVLRMLKDNHPEEFEQLYAQELAKAGLPARKPKTDVNATLLSAIASMRANDDEINLRKLSKASGRSTEAVRVRLRKMIGDGQLHVVCASTDSPTTWVKHLHVTPKSEPE
jgi:hypothetical protein